MLVSEILERVDSPTGRARVAAALAAGPFPQYEPHPDRRWVLERTVRGPWAGSWGGGFNRRVPNNGDEPSAGSASGRVGECRIGKVVHRSRLKLEREFMTITVELGPEVQAELSRRAAEHGSLAEA